MKIEPIDLCEVARPNLFTLIRYVLVIAIVANHALILSDCQPTSILDLDTCVDGFFIISGYWATYSYVRSCSTMKFYGRRAMRIFPEYWFVVLFCLFIGALSTTLPAAEFFASSHTWKYLVANLLTINAACPTLPGVFEDNLYPEMNGSLWFVKVVLSFYIVLPLIACRHSSVASPLMLLVLYALSFDFLFAVDTVLPPSFAWMAHQLPGVMMYFVAGMCALKLFPWLIRHKAIAFCVGLSLYIADEWMRGSMQGSGLWLQLFDILRPIAMALLIFAVAYSSDAVANKLRCVRDYSYGLFLFHFPLLQAVLSLGLIEFHEEYTEGVIETSVLIETRPDMPSLWFYTVVVIVASLLLSIVFNACWKRVAAR